MNYVSNMNFVGPFLLKEKNFKVNKHAVNIFKNFLVNNISKFLIFQKYEIMMTLFYFYFYF